MNRLVSFVLFHVFRGSSWFVFTSCDLVVPVSRRPAETTNTHENYTKEDNHETHEPHETTRRALEFAPKRL